MSEKLKAALSVAIKVVLYLCFVALTIIGVQNTGWADLGLEIIGLAGVIGVLWWYNVHHQ